MCLKEGWVKPATVADHVVPHRGNERLFWFGELQSLCEQHHNKTKKDIEDKGFSTDIGVDGYPLDQRHPFLKSRGDGEKIDRT